MHGLYQNDVVSEEALWKWKDQSAESDLFKVFVTYAEPFLKQLKNCTVEEEGDEEEENIYKGLEVESGDVVFDNEDRMEKLEAQKEKKEGNKYYQDREYDKALKCYNSAIELDPSDLTIKYNRIVCLFRMGSYSECSKYAFDYLEYLDRNKIKLYNRCVEEILSRMLKERNKELAEQRNDEIGTSDV